MAYIIQHNHEYKRKDETKGILTTYFHFGDLVRCYGGIEGAKEFPSKALAECYIKSKRLGKNHKVKKCLRPIIK